MYAIKVVNLKQRVSQVYKEAREPDGMNTFTSNQAF